MKADIALAGFPPHEMPDLGNPRYGQEAACLRRGKEPARLAGSAPSSIARAGGESQTERGPTLLSDRNRLPSWLQRHFSVMISPMRRLVSSSRMNAAVCGGLA